MGGHKSDNAIAINVLATQETSGFGVSWQPKEEAFSDAHDVVLVPLHWGNHRESKNSAAQPVSRSARIDARPTRAEEEMHSRTGKKLKLENYCGPHGTNPPYDDSQCNQISVGVSLAQTATGHAAPATVGVSLVFPWAPAATATAYDKHETPKSSAAQPAGLEQSSIDSECATDANATSPEHGDAHHSPDQDRTTPPPVSDEIDDADCDEPEYPTHLWSDTDEDIISVAPSLSLPSVHTPLYNDLLEKLSGSDDAESIDTLADLFIFRQLKWKKPHGSAEQPAQSSNDPYSLGLRVEHLLNVTQTQRSHQIARLATRSDPRVESPDTLEFSPRDMKELMNAWRQQPETWMDPASLTKVNAMTTQQDYHQACKKRFNTMLFQLFGNKSLVETFIRIPICSAAQPASVLSAFAKAWHNVKDSPQVCTARENSQKQVNPRLSKQIYKLGMMIKRGEWIADWLATDWDNWYRLSVADQHLSVEYEQGNLKRQMAELRAQQQPKFPGIAQSLMPEL